ncbi:MAG: DUF481 domain-containing protein, partial [Rhodanobacteraceae bacterium]
MEQPRTNNRSKLSSKVLLLREFPKIETSLPAIFYQHPKPKERSSVRAIRKFLFIAISLSVMQSALADDLSKLDAIGGAAPSKYNQGLAGHVSLGYTATTGNSDTSNLDAKFGVSYARGKWYHVFSAEEIHATDSGGTTAQNTQADAQSDYLFTPKNYMFGHLGYDHDQFSGVERRTSETLGYGRRLLDT